MRIEPILPADIPALVEMCRVGHLESRYREFGFAHDKVVMTFAEAIVNPDMLAIKCRDGEEIAGFFVGTVSAMEFSEDPFGAEVSFLVRPEYRGRRCALLLLNAFFDWCKIREIPAFVAIHYADDNSKTYRFLEKLGMAEIGRMFAYSTR